MIEEPAYKQTSLHILVFKLTKTGSMIDIFYLAGWLIVTSYGHFPNWK